MNPKVSVIMPVYNAEKFLKYSIESVLNQTFKDFEFIIINDGSTDNSLEIIKEYQKKDNRIKTIDQENNGIIKSLNNALKEAKGYYIARMDADDISNVNRIEKQVDFLEKENAFICGSWAEIIDENNNLTGKIFNYPPKTWIKNKIYLLRGNPLIHSSVMFKKEIYDKAKDIYGNLYKNFKHIEDYELWTRLIPKYKTINITENLLKYRIHKNQITKRVNLTMRTTGLKIRLWAFFRLI